jgi:anti-sigma regulatory factor (Ser/Thr protein kinase)
VTDHKSFTFRREPKTVRTARGLLADLHGKLPKSRLYDATVCLTEIVANAVQHPRAEGELALTLALERDRLRVEVTDPGSGFEVEPRADDREGGWGLQIVESLADGWGIEAGERTVVWFEILRAPHTN